MQQDSAPDRGAAGDTDEAAAVAADIAGIDPAAMDDQESTAAFRPVRRPDAGEDAPRVAGSFRYPVADYGVPLKQLRGAPETTLSGNLLGVKGQYLMLSTGVLNVRRHQGYEVTVTFQEPFPEQPGGASDQLALF